MSFTPMKPTSEQMQAIEVARVAFMTACPFYAHYFYSEMKEVFTTDIPTAATDGRRIFINPEYLMTLKPPERVFVYAHEVDHVIMRDPQRMAHYGRLGKVGKREADAKHWNVCTDYRINAGLMEQGVGMMNPSWLYAADVTGDAVSEEIYEKKWKDRPKGGYGGAGGGSTYGQSGKAPKGMKGDKTADANGGAFDQVLPPQTDPATGKEDLPDEQEFKEAIARAAAAAKAVGKMPASLQRRIDEILEPQVDWKDRIRMLMTGRIGSRSEDWTKANRRRLVLNPMVVMPGRRGFGAELVAVMVDTSGSIGERELNTFLAEVGGILADVRPRNIIVIGCDAAVTQVDEVRTLDELGELRRKGIKGGGGTSFKPPFDYLAERNLRPETAVYLTDMLGDFPEPQPFPVIWAATTDKVGPFGDTVRIEVREG